MKNKKAQEMSTGAIALIILAVIVLVVLVLGFSIGWEKILPFLSKTNTESIQTSCLAACTGQQVANFCSLPKTVKDGVNPKFEATCNSLLKGQMKNGTTIGNPLNYGIMDCSNLCS